MTGPIALRRQLERMRIAGSTHADIEQYMRDHPVQATPTDPPADDDSDTGPTIAELRRAAVERFTDNRPTRGATP